MGKVGPPTWNFDAFDEAKAVLERLGWVPISPADLDRLHEGWGQYPPPDCVVTTADKKRFMTRDIAAINTCDAVFMLTGWEESSGARIEHAYAEYIGLQVIYESDGLTEWTT
jgi:nucleoside 2-deoxyribosyltransferase